MLEEQPGDEPPAAVFVFHTEAITQSQLPCYLTYTNARTHAIIQQNLDRSPLYSGVIKGIGPRYCPSIEDKVKRFPDKRATRFFWSRKGGRRWKSIPTASPPACQRMCRWRWCGPSHGLEEAEIMRPGYAVEYDFVPPDGTQADAGNQARARLVSRRADQRHHGL